MSGGVFFSFGLLCFVVFLVSVWAVAAGSFRVVLPLLLAVWLVVLPGLVPS